MAFFDRHPKTKRRVNMRSKNGTAMSRKITRNVLRKKKLRNPPQAAGSASTRQVTCYNAKTGLLESTDTSLHGLAVELMEMGEPDAQGNVQVVVASPQLQGRVLRTSLCTEEPTGVEATPVPDSVPPGCCIDEATGLIQCPGGTDAFYMHGRTIPKSTYSCWTNDQGQRMCTISAGGDVTYDLPVCEQPEQVPDGCCVDTDAMVILCQDTTHPLHGAKVTSVSEVRDNGLVTLSFVGADGVERNTRLPLCQIPDESQCCYDAINGVVLCDDPNNPMHNQPAELVEGVGGDGYVYVCGTLDPQSSAITCARMPLCPDQPPGCCYDAFKGLIVCDNGEFPHGVSPEVVKQDEDDNGKPFVVVIHPQVNDGNRLLLYLCPEPPPLECCYDAATGTLRCPGNAQFDGLEVSLEHMTDTMPDGNVHAVVSHPDLPGGMGQFRLCEDGVPDGCCYDGQRKVLVCPGDPELDGRPAGVVTKFTGPDGRTWVSVSWEGGGARMPLCTEECPPVFCCVNLQTGKFVCPGESDLNGQQADVVDMVTDNQGYNFAVLQDGLRVPVCGKDCPPPELCPKCPTCPPGMWMTPDKQCVDPPRCIPPGGHCPPGMYWDSNGICRRRPDCPKCGCFPCCCSSTKKSKRKSNPAYDAFISECCYDPGSNSLSCPQNPEFENTAVVLESKTSKYAILSLPHTKTSQQPAYKIKVRLCSYGARQEQVGSLQQRPKRPVGKRSGKKRVARSTKLTRMKNPVRTFAASPRSDYERCVQNCTGGKTSLIGPCVRRCSRLKQRSQRRRTAGGRSLYAYA